MDYADRQQLNRTMRKTLLEVVRGLDAEWLKWQKSLAKR